MTQAQIKALIDEKITTNVEQEITGAVLNNVLQAIADACGYTFDIDVYPADAALEVTFYNPSNPDGEAIKINADVSNLGNSKLEAISAWWAAQKERRINEIGGFTIEKDSVVDSSPTTLGLFQYIAQGQIIDSITGATSLIFISNDTPGQEVTVNAADLPYTAAKTFVSVKSPSGTLTNVSIKVRGSLENMPSYININEIANHPAAYADAAAALADVPEIYRRKGTKVVYYDDDTQLWIEMLCYDDAGGANWWTDVDNNWAIEGPIETKLATATGGQQLRIAGEKRGNLDDVLNVNVWNEQIYEYESKADARAAVPANKRKLGGVITYLIDGMWYTEQFIGSSTSTWTTTESDWEVLGPVSVSQNTLSIGGNYAGEMSTTYDVTLHSGQTFASLSALFSDANLNTLIPLVVRKGGMSIKFVQTSDNKYVQARCMAQNFTTDVTQWQVVDAILINGSENLAESKAVLSKTNKTDFKLNSISFDVIPSKQNYLSIELDVNDSIYIYNDSNVQLSLKARLEDGSYVTALALSPSTYQTYTPDNKIYGFKVYGNNTTTKTITISKDNHIVDVIKRNNNRQEVIFDTSSCVIVQGNVYIFDCDLSQGDKIYVKNPSVDGKQVTVKLVNKDGSRTSNVLIVNPSTIGNYTIDGDYVGIVFGTNSTASLTVPFAIKPNVSNLPIGANTIIDRLNSLESNVITIADDTPVEGKITLTKGNSSYVLPKSDAFEALKTIVDGNSTSLTNLTRRVTTNDDIKVITANTNFKFYGDFLTGDKFILVIDNIDITGVGSIVYYVYQGSTLLTTITTGGIYTLNCPDNSENISVQVQKTGTVTTFTSKCCIIRGTNLAIWNEAAKQYILKPNVWTPQKMYMLKGTTFEVFRNSIALTVNPENYIMILKNHDNSQCGYNRGYKYEYAVGNNADFSLTFGVQNEIVGEVYAEHPTQMIHVSKKSSPATNKNILCIGDSFTADGRWVSEFKRLLTGVVTEGKSAAADCPVTADALTNLTFIGTTVSSVTPTQSASGKSYDYFISNQSPFWNPNANSGAGCVDFDYYCQQNGYSQIDYCCIMLGTNGYATQQYIAPLWDALLEHNANIKVLVMGCCFANPYGAGEGGIRPNQNYMNLSVQTNKVNYRLEQLTLLDEYKDNFLYVDYNTRVDIFENMRYFILQANIRNADAKVRSSTDSYDNVHPYTPSYYQIADAVRAGFHYWCLE